MTNPSNLKRAILPISPLRRKSPCLFLSTANSIYKVKMITPLNTRQNGTAIALISPCFCRHHPPSPRRSKINPPDPLSFDRNHPKRCAKATPLPARKATPTAQLGSDRKGRADTLCRTNAAPFLFSAVRAFRNRLKHMLRSKFVTLRDNLSLSICDERPPSGVDFDELLRIAATKKRAELREERRKKHEVYRSLYSQRRSAQI